MEWSVTKLRQAADAKIGVPAFCRTRDRTRQVLEETVQDLAAVNSFTSRLTSFKSSLPVVPIGSAAT